MLGGFFSVWETMRAGGRRSLKKQCCAGMDISFFPNFARLFNKDF